MHGYLSDEHLLQDPGAVPEWRDIATEMRTRRRAPVFPPDITCSQVSDIPPSQVCLAWDASRRSRLIQDFAAIATDHPPVAGIAAPLATL